MLTKLMEGPTPVSALIHKKINVGYLFLCTRIKFRETPKALITKIIKETL